MVALELIMESHEITARTIVTHKLCLCISKLVRKLWLERRVGHNTASLEQIGLRVAPSDNLSPSIARTPNLLIGNPET